MQLVAQHAYVARHGHVGERDQPEIEIVEDRKPGHNGNAGAGRDGSGNRTVFVRFEHNIRRKRRFLELVGKLTVDDRVVRDRNKLFAADLRERDGSAVRERMRRGHREIQLLARNGQVFDRVDIGLARDQKIQRSVQKLFDEPARHALMEAERGLTII